MERPGQVFQSSTGL